MVIKVHVTAEPGDFQQVRRFFTWMQFSCNHCVERGEGHYSPWKQKYVNFRKTIIRIV